VANPFGSITSSVLLPQRRFTILLLGSDNDKKFTADAVLTQSMILVSIDPATREVSMVSIPRDFWVPIPTYGSQKIDVAYEVGGIALARTTVEDLLGIHVDYYAWVGLDGLVQVIDSLGGVNVTVLHPILDETYPDDLTGPNPYAFFRLYIPAGPQHLNGTTALEYVRSRHGDLQSDFGRSARQQQVLLAIKDLATDPAMIAHIPELAASLNGAVKTDLSLPQIIQLANLARGISTNQIRQQVLAAPQFASFGWSPDRQEEVVIPDWPAIRPVLAALLHLHSDGVNDALADQARQEKATIRALNGTGEAGLASQVKDYLAWQGLSVVSTGNARRFDYSHSQILLRDNSKRATAQLLATALDATVTGAPDPTLPTDVTVVVGADHPALPVPQVAYDAAGVPLTALPTEIPSPGPTEPARLALTPSPTHAVPVTDRAGQVVVPSFIGLPEAFAQRAIMESGLMTTYVNYQIASDVADKAYFLSIPPGAVLSQLPAPGTHVPRGTKVALAVRKA
jgi:LCP family protein required for cell wall assembly